MKELIIENMTIEEKIGQLVMVGFHGDTLDDALLTLIRNYHAGNIIYFKRNLRDAGQSARLSLIIQNEMLKRNGVQAFIAIDQEGGLVNRIFRGVTIFPGAMAVAAATDSEGCHKIGESMGYQLKKIGINMNLAPVLDVNTNKHNPVIGVRSYSDSPKTVAEMASSFIRGLQSQGIIATAKHFPGHGDTHVDSHLGLPTVDKPCETLIQEELHPFKRAIEDGIGAIMSAHIMYPAFEPEHIPATMSKKILTGLLRETLNFDGLIITDCMEMHAITKNYGSASAAVMAIKAGANLLCLSHTYDIQVECIERIKEAVLSGEISMDIIDRSVTKVLQYKRMINLFDAAMDYGEISSKRLEMDNALAKKISQDSITIFSRKKDAVPINDKKKILAISPIARSATIAEDDLLEVNFARMLSRAFGAHFLNYEVNSKNSLNISEASLKEYELIIFASCNMFQDESQKQTYRQLALSRVPILHVALKSPYDAELCQEADAHLFAYEYTPLSAESLLEVLKGKYEPKGKLPVKLSL